MIPSLLFKAVSPLPSAMEMYAAMCDVGMSHTHFLFVKLVQEFWLNLSLYWRSALKIACQNQCSASYCPPKETHLRFAEKNTCLELSHFCISPVISCIRAHYLAGGIIRMSNTMHLWLVMLMVLRIIQGVQKATVQLLLPRRLVV